MTAAPPTLAILVPTLGERATLFGRLVSSLLPQTEPYAGRARVLGWFNNGTPSLPEIRQSLSETDRHLRDISHINPIRRDLALTADFRRSRAGAAEDRAWAAQLRRSGVLKTEALVDRIMYHYLYSTSRTPGQGSRWRNTHTIHRAPTGRRTIDHPNFPWSARDR